LCKRRGELVKLIYSLVILQILFYTCIIGPGIILIFYLATELAIMNIKWRTDFIARIYCCYIVTDIETFHYFISSFKYMYHNVSLNQNNIKQREYVLFIFYFIFIQYCNEWLKKKFWHNSINSNIKKNIYTFNKINYIFYFIKTKITVVIICSQINCINE